MLSVAGGTFAVYSLLCRFARISPFGPAHASDQTLNKYSTSQCVLSTLGVGHMFRRLWQSRVISHTAVARSGVAPADQFPCLRMLCDLFRWPQHRL